MARLCRLRAPRPRVYLQECAFPDATFRQYGEVVVDLRSLIHIAAYESYVGRADLGIHDFVREVKAGRGHESDDEDGLVEFPPRKRAACADSRPHAHCQVCNRRSARVALIYAEVRPYELERVTLCKFCRTGARVFTFYHRYDRVASYVMDGEAGDRDRAAFRADCTDECRIVHETEEDDPIEMMTESACNPFLYESYDDSDDECGWEDDDEPVRPIAAGPIGSAVNPIVVDDAGATRDDPVDLTCYE